MRTVSNFGRNIEFQPTSIYSPTSVEEVLAILDQHRGQEIRAIGSLHSWSPAPATTGILLELNNLTAIEVERTDDSAAVTVGAGCQLKKLFEFLAIQGLTLPSSGLIDEQTVAGATATGTHGSGKHSLSHYIESVSIAHYDPTNGDAKLSNVDSGQDLKAARCSLGLMGIIVAIKFRCRPSYRIEEHVRAHESLQTVLAAEPEYPQQQFYLIPWSWRYFAHHRVESERPVSNLAPLYRAYNFLGIDVGLHVAMYGLAKILRSSWAVRFFYQQIVPLTVIRNWKIVDHSSSILTMQHELFRHIEIEVFVQLREAQRSHPVADRCDFRLWRTGFSASRDNRIITDAMRSLARTGTTSRILRSSLSDLRETYSERRDVDFDGQPQRRVGRGLVFDQPDQPSLAE